MPEKPLILQHIEGWQSLVEQRNQQAMKDLASNWETITSSLRGDLEEFIDWMSEHPELVNSARLMQEDRFAALLAQAKAKNNSFRAYFSGYVTNEQEQMLGIGVASGVDLIETAFIEAGIYAPQFDVLNVSTLDYMIGYTASGAPLYDLLEEDYLLTAESIRQGLITGLAAGLGTRNTANLIYGSMDNNLQRALTIARTEQMRALRTAEQATIKQSKVCDGFVRRSQRASNVCPSCIALDGKFYQVDEQFDSHPNCACYLEPKITGYNPDIPSSRDWFDTLPPKQQEDMLGPSLYQAYKTGDLNWDEIPEIIHDPIWGNTIRQHTLKELGIPKYTPPPAPKTPPPAIPTQADVMSFGPPKWELTQAESDLLTGPPEPPSPLGDFINNPPPADAIKPKAATAPPAAAPKKSNKLPTWSHDPKQIKEHPSIIHLSEWEKSQLNRRAAEYLKSGQGLDYYELLHMNPGAGDIKNAIATTLQKKTGLSYNFPNGFLKQWAQTSNDTDLRALSVQERASKLFNSPLSPWQKQQLASVYKSRRDELAWAAIPGHNPNISGTSLYLFEAQVGEEKAIQYIDQLLQATYEMTQESFAKEGITEVVLYRGIAVDETQLAAMGYKTKFPQRGEVLRKSNILRNAMESWTSDPGTASSFSGMMSSAHGKQYRLMVQIRVPVEDIYSTAISGQGCYNEHEFILLNRPRDVMVVSFNR